MQLTQLLALELSLLYGFLVCKLFEFAGLLDSLCLVDCSIQCIVEVFLAGTGQLFPDGLA